MLLLLSLSGVAAAAEEPRTILVVGDSISAGYGVAVEDSWVGRLRRRLEAEDRSWQVVNASVSGDTSSGALARLPAALERHDPEVVIIQVGGNDGLRGLPLEAMRDNLAGMVEQARASGARVLLLGIRLPPNYGPAYTERFVGVYQDVADRTGVQLVPRVLAGVGERREFMQADDIHPNAAGHERILETVWPRLEPLLQRSDTPA